MAKKIYKYNLAINDEQVIYIPLVKILTVQMQNGSPKLWAIVDENVVEIPVQIYIFGTGHELPEIDLNYISSFKSVGDMFIFHVFYEKIENQ